MIRKLKHLLFYYELKRMPYVEGIIFFGYEYKTVYPAELKEYLNNGWEISKRKVILLTPLFENWQKIKLSEKLGIITVVISLITVAISIYSVFVMN